MLRRRHRSLERRRAAVNEVEVRFEVPLPRRNRDVFVDLYLERILCGRWRREAGANNRNGGNDATRGCAHIALERVPIRQR